MLFVCADQWLKWLVRHRMSPGESIPLLTGCLHLTYVQNTGAAFGMLRGAGPLLVLLSVAVIGALAYSLRRDAQIRTNDPSTRATVSGRGLAQDSASQAIAARLHWPWRCRQWGTWLILAGALGNLIDRLWFGHVIDFIDLRVWPVFNLADSAISVGIGLLLWGILRHGDSPSAP